MMAKPKEPKAVETAVEPLALPPVGPLAEPAADPGTELETLQRKNEALRDRLRQLGATPDAELVRQAGPKHVRFNPPGSAAVVAPPAG